MQEWQRHIRHPHADQTNKALCGVSVNEWDKPFQDVDHAFLTIEQGGMLLPCFKCAQVVIDNFSGAIAVEA